MGQETQTNDSSHFLQQFLELTRQHNQYLTDRVDLVASNSWVSSFARLTMGSYLSNSYSIGFPGNRLYGGCSYIDMIEREVMQLAQDLYKMPYAVVQYLSGMQANIGAFHAMLEPGDVVVAAPTKFGGHYSHNAQGPLRYYSPEIIPIDFDPSQYNVDLDKLQKTFRKHQPKLIILGWSEFLFPHPLPELRELCNHYGVKLMYDMSHVAGLIAGGEFQPDVSNYADIITSSTGKSLHAPDHGMVLYRDTELRHGLHEAVMPILTSNTHPHEMAALGITLAEMKEFGRDYASQVVKNSKALGKALNDFGFKVMYEDLGYSDSHMLLVEFDHATTAVHLLDHGGISINACELPEDQNGVVSGMRLGTQVVTRRGMKEMEMEIIAEGMAKILLHRVDPAKVRYEIINELAKNYNKVAYSFDQHFPLGKEWQEAAYQKGALTNAMDLAMVIPAFAKLPVNVVQKIAPEMTVIKAKTGEILFKEGNACDSIYFIYRGTIQLFEHLEDREGVLSTVKDGSQLGELEVLLRKKWGFTARITEPTILLKLGAAPLLKLLDRHPELKKHFSEDLKNYQLEKELQKKEAKEETDSLTGLNNEQAFNEYTSMELYRARREKNGMSIGHLDINHFKEFNEKNGEESSRKVLQVISNTLKNSIRTVDVCARMGGDDFMVLLPGAGGNEAKVVLKRLQDRLNRVMKEHDWPLEIRVGAITFQSLPESAKEALQKADHLMGIVRESKKQKFRHEVYV